MTQVCLVSSTTTWLAVTSYVSPIRKGRDKSQPNLLFGCKQNGAAILVYSNSEALHVVEQFGVKYALGSGRKRFRSAAKILSKVP